MKKFLMVALVLGLVFSMAQVTVADDRVKFDGHTRIRAYYIDKDDVADADNLERYIDFRFRLGAEVTVAEGITANLRLDFQDNSVWGKDTEALGRATEDNEMTVERAFIRIDKDMFTFQGGEIWQGFGYFSAYTPQGVGLAMRLKLPVAIDLNYFKYSEGSAVTDDDDANDLDKDHDVYALQATYKTDTFTIGGYYGTAIDGSKVSYENKNVIGLFGDTKLGPVAIKGAVDMFSGTQSDTVDYMGTQMWLNGEMALVENFTFGADIWYALAADEDGSEEQIVRLLEPYEMADVPFDVYCKVNHLGRHSDTTSPLGNGFPTPYEITDSTGTADNAGVMAFDLYGLFNVTENLTLGASLGYWMPQDDNENITDRNSLMLFQGSVLWSFAPGCDLFAGFYHRTDDYEDVDDIDAELGLYSVLRINF